MALHVEINKKKGQQPLKRSDYRNRHGLVSKLPGRNVALATEPAHEPVDGKVRKQSDSEADYEQYNAHRPQN